MSQSERESERKPTIRWGQRQTDARIYMKVIGARDPDRVVLRNDDRYPDKTVLDLGPDDAFVLFGRLDVDACTRRSTADSLERCLELSAAPTSADAAAWPRLLAAPGGHPRVKVDWSAWRSVHDSSDDSSDER